MINQDIIISLLTSMLLRKVRLKRELVKKSNRSQSSQAINAEIGQRVDVPTFSGAASFSSTPYSSDDWKRAKISDVPLNGSNSTTSVHLPCSQVSCSATFASISALNLHEYSTHGSPGLFSCLICESRFATFQQTESHVISQHTDNRVQCNACLFLCETYNSLKVHIHLHVAEDAQQCVLCPLTFTKCSDLESHVAFHYQCGDAYRPANFSFYCTDCNCSFATNQSLIDHLCMEHSYSSVLVCIYCGLCFATLESQLKHHQLCIPNGICAGISNKNASFERESIFKCRYCTESFEKPSQVKLHESTHRFKCNMCNFETARYNLFASHSRTHNLLPMCKCKACGEEFPKRQALEIHLKEMHDGEMKFLCEICGKRFMGKRDLTLHAKSHSRNFLCPFPHCGARFATSSDLRRHQRSRHIKIPYRCEYCNKTFSQHSTLKIHVRVTHTKCE